jgi:hypothetical protein
VVGPIWSVLGLLRAAGCRLQAAGWTRSHGILFLLLQGLRSPGSLALRSSMWTPWACCTYVISTSRRNTLVLPTVCTPLVRATYSTTYCTGLYVMYTDITTNIRIYECTNVRMYECTNVRIHAPTSVIWRWEEKVCQLPRGRGGGLTLGRTHLSTNGGETMGCPDF